MLWGLALKFLPRVLPLLKSWKAALGLVLLVALGANFWYINHLQDGRDEEREKKAMFAQWYQTCADANASNTATIKTLKGANNSLAAAIRVSEEERVAAVKAAVERTARAEAQLDDTLDSLEDLRNETPDCEALSAIDMGAVCPAVTERLREHAAGTIDRD